MNEVRYLPFSLTDSRYFNLHSTKSGIDKNKLIQNGFEYSFPYITRTDKNNGCDMFVSQQDKPFDDGNTITIGLDTQTVFYQPHPFYTGQNIQVLESPFMTKKVALFLIPLIKRQLRLLNWGGNGATLGRLRVKKIVLPVDENDSPNWEYMESKVDEILQNDKQALVIKDFSLPKLQLSEVEWKPFSISDFFKTERGKSEAKSKLTPGLTPLISARKQFNGFDSFVDVEKEQTSRETITVNNNGDGGAGIAFFHNYRYVSTQDVTTLKEKIPLSKEAKIFFSVCITHQSKKFGFGNKVTSKRLLHQKIMLPTDKEGNVNYDYMEEYVRSILNPL